LDKNSDFTVRIPAESSEYPIFISTNEWNSLGEFCRYNFKDYNFVLVSDSGVPKKYVHQVRNEIRIDKDEPVVIFFPEGEKNKTYDTCKKIQNYLFERNLGKKTVILALGGGVTGDLAGFAAATFKRGIPYIQLPTTLLAQVDSSVGGKTAINNRFGKNMIGVFHNPAAVFINISTLETLDRRQFLNGLAEVIKTAIIGDQKLFEYLAENNEKILSKNPDAMSHLIHHSISVKKKIVEADPFENGYRRILNFGHTAGHAVEKASNYKLLHGEAIAIGISVESEMLYQKKKVSAENYEGIKGILELYGLDREIAGSCRINFNDIENSIQQDKKRQKKSISIIAVEKIGKTSKNENRYIMRVVLDEILNSIKRYLLSTQHII
jgi:3-dehydroquinate synthase